MNKFLDIIRKIGFVSILLVAICDFGFTQNIKKAYKQITKNEINDARNELKLFSPTFKDNAEFNLFSLANCLVLCNPKVTDSDPYKALNMYEKLNFTTLEQKEINGFLEKYELNISKIRDTIFYRILEIAKKQNSESSYMRALEVCDGCFYKQEVTKLKEEAAYIKALTSNTKNVFQTFLKAYPNSIHVDEIKGLLEKVEYDDAKKEMSPVSLGNFIKIYPASIHVNEIKELLEKIEFAEAKKGMSLASLNKYIKAYWYQKSANLDFIVNIRDSIAYSQTPKTYLAYSSFLGEYPNSRYNDSIKVQLPKLLFSQAVKENNVEMLEMYINKFPEDSHIQEAKNLIEKISYNNLNDNFSTTKFNEFKKRFPNSEYLSEIDKKLEKITSNSDLRKIGLIGSVKSVETKGYLEGDTNFYFDRTDTYNEIGNIIEIKATGTLEDYEDGVNEFESICKDDKRVLITGNIGGEIKEGSQSLLNYFGVGFIGAYHTLNYGFINFEYDQNKLIQVKSDKNNQIWKFTYDENNKAVTKDIFLGNNLQYKIKYTWNDEKLTSKKIYKGDGSRYAFFDYSYYPSKIVVYAQAYVDNAIQPIFSGKSYNNIIRTIYDFDNSNNLINATYGHKSYEGQFDYEIDTEEKYTYSRGYLTSCFQRHFGNSRQRGVISTNIEFNRDLHGMITSTKTCRLLLDDTVLNSKEKTECKTSGVEWEYKYDSNGNWIERTKYEVNHNDIDIRTKKEVVKRIIVYN